MTVTRTRSDNLRGGAWLVVLLALTFAGNVSAEDRYAAPGEPGAARYLNPIQLGELVAPIALYPDELLAIVLPASTDPLAIVQAARYLAALESSPEHEPDAAWDDAIVALLNYPEVITMMDRDLAWTERLGEAVITQQADVLDAIGTFRGQAHQAGNLRSNKFQVVENGPQNISIRSADPAVTYVPHYQPATVLAYQYQPVPPYYYRSRPSYAYPHSNARLSGFGNFWGVSSLFSIAWSQRRLGLRGHRHYDSHAYDRPHRGQHFRRHHDRNTARRNLARRHHSDQRRSADTSRSVAPRGSSSTRNATAARRSTSRAGVARAAVSPARNVPGIARSTRRIERSGARNRATAANRANRTRSVTGRPTTRPTSAARATTSRDSTVSRSRSRRLSAAASSSPRPEQIRPTRATQRAARAPIVRARSTTATRATPTVRPIRAERKASAKRQQRPDRAARGKRSVERRNPPRRQSGNSQNARKRPRPASANRASKALARNQRR